MKIRCSRCKRRKDEKKFYYKNREKGIRQSYCIPCGKAYSAADYEKHSDAYKKRAKDSTLAAREYINKAKARPCADCEIQYPYYVMQFDHNGHKDFMLGNAANRRLSLVKIQAEIDKCEVVCANCHAERTHGRLVQR